MLPVDEVVDHAPPKRARAVEGVQRDQVLEPLGLRLPQDVPHARALELEHAQRLALREQLVGLRVVERQRREVDHHAGGPLDGPDGIVEQRQRAQAQEVHLQEADALDLLHPPLGRDFVPGTLVEGRVLGNRLRRDHDAGRMNRRVARHPLEPARHLQQVLDTRVAGLEIPQRLALGERLVECDVECRRDELRHLVRVGVGDVHRPADVADDRPRLHRAKRDDLGDVLAAVLPGDVLDDLSAPALAEVDVDVGQGHPLGVQEPLEDQIELQRIHVRDVERVGHDAACGRPAARPHGNAALARVADEVPDDQEIPAVLHLLDHRDLVRHPFHILVQAPPELPRSRRGLEPLTPPGEALPDHPLEVVVERDAGGHLELGQLVHRLAEVDVAPLGNAHGVGHRVRNVGEHARHLLRRFQVELVAEVAQALGIVHRLAGPDAQQHVMCPEVLPIQVVNVVRANERQPEGLRHALQADVDRALVVDALVLHLEEEVAGAQDVAVGGSSLDGALFLFRAQMKRDLPLEAAAQPDQPARVLRQEFLVDARTVVEPLGVGGRNQLDEVRVALAVLRQEHEVIVALADTAALREPAAGRHVGFAPEDRLDALLSRLVVEDDRREQVPVLGHRQGRHLLPRGLLEQLVDPARAVQQRVRCGDEGG